MDNLYVIIPRNNKARATAKHIQPAEYGGESVLIVGKSMEDFFALLEEIDEYNGLFGTKWTLQGIGDPKSKVDIEW